MNDQEIKVFIIGLGLTGTAMARYFLNRGCQVQVTDKVALTSDDSRLRTLPDHGNRLKVCPYHPDSIMQADWVIPSPGVPPTDLILQKAVERGVPICSELDIAAQSICTPIIAVTGTNGKTTVTTLIGEMLKQSGYRVFVGGNIGCPLISYIDGPQNADVVVAEVSSFQLQWTFRFHARVALYLNATPDHSDYHGNFDTYRATKAKIFQNMTRQDLAILNGDDPWLCDIASAIPARTVYFSSTREIRPGMYAENGNLVWAVEEGADERYPLQGIKLPGRHNQENVMAAILAVREVGADRETFLHVLAHFPGLPHRIEYVTTKAGALYYNDSKGTNVDAVVRALEAFSVPVILLMGGRDKEGNFTALIPFLKKHVKRIVLFGEAREVIQAMIGNHPDTMIVATMREAVLKARSVAQTGDVVLLSPGCASFDEFNNYKERGNVFRQIVESL